MSHLSFIVSSGRAEVAKPTQFATFERSTQGGQALFATFFGSLSTAIQDSRPARRQFATFPGLFATFMPRKAANGRVEVANVESLVANFARFATQFAS